MVAICKGPWSIQYMGVAIAIYFPGGKGWAWFLAVSLVRWTLLGFDEYSGWRIRTKKTWWRNVGKECFSLEGSLTDYISWLFQGWKMMMESKKQLAGGFKYVFYFQPYLGKMIHFDKKKCQMGWNLKPPTRWWWNQQNMQVETHTEAPWSWVAADGRR